MTQQEIWRVIIDRIKIISEEQNLKNKIQALSGIDDVYLDTICDTCKSRTTESDEYLHILNEIITMLSDGWCIEYISYCLQGDKYTGYKGEENIMPTKSFNLKLMGIDNMCFYTKDPKVVDVNIIVPEKVVEVTFADGTKEKSVCKEPDTFSLESAISICISKKIMGGSGAYNNAVKRGMKVYQDKLNKEAAEKEEQERIEKKCAKRLAYKERRAVKRAEEESRRKAQEKEEEIEIQKEAYLRAVRELKESENNYIYGE